MKLRYQQGKKQFPIYASVIPFLIVSLAFCFYFFLARYLPMQNAPDEMMRYQVPLWIYRHHALPIGNETDLIDSTYGFSYAFLPYLPSIIAAGFMKCVSLFRSSEHALLFAARMVSVLAGTAVVYLCLKIGPHLFRSRWSTYFFAILVGFLPQFIFLSSYLNNDVFSLFTDFLILYALLEGRQNKWKWRTCALLALAISLNLLTYYNAYGWVAVSALFCIISCVQDKQIQKKLRFILPRVLFVAVLVCCLAGWYFIRNAILYDGDFLGRNAARECARHFAAAGNTVHDNISASENGLSIWEMLNDGLWVPTTIESFIGVFGYLDCFLPNQLYAVYKTIIFVGLLLAVFTVRSKGEHGLLTILLVPAMILPTVLAIIYTYTEDYQPQGRYVMPMLPALAIFVTFGYDWLAERMQSFGGLKVQYSRNAEALCEKKVLADAENSTIKLIHFNPTFILALIWIFLGVFVYQQVLKPNYFPQDCIGVRVSDDGKYLDITYTAAGNYDNVEFAVWNPESDAEVEWVSAQPDGDRRWYGVADSHEANVHGEYYVHVYTQTDKGPVFLIGTNASIIQTVHPIPW